MCSKGKQICHLNGLLHEVVLMAGGYSVLEYCCSWLKAEGSAMSHHSTYSWYVWDS